MMQKGDLYKSKKKVFGNEENVIVQVMRTYDKRDIDPECPLSVAIVPMVQLVVWSGNQTGRVYSYNRRVFCKQYEKIGAAQ